MDGENVVTARTIQTESTSRMAFVCSSSDLPGCVGFRRSAGRAARFLMVNGSWCYPWSLLGTLLISSR
jgi:hypothetical protein